MNGYFGIGVLNLKTEHNLGSLWRGAYQLGADFIFTIGGRYKKQSSDVYKTWSEIPLFQFETLKDLKLYNCQIVAVEMGGVSLPEFQHPRRAVYLLGAEDHGLPPKVIEQCHYSVSLPSVRANSYNVAQAGTLVMYDRVYG